MRFEASHLHVKSRRCHVNRASTRESEAHQQERVAVTPKEDKADRGLNGLCFTWLISSCRLVAITKSVSYNNKAKLGQGPESGHRHPENITAKNVSTSETQPRVTPSQPWQNQEPKESRGPAVPVPWDRTQKGSVYRALPQNPAPSKDEPGEESEVDCFLYRSEYRAWIKDESLLVLHLAVRISLPVRTVMVFEKKTK